MSETENTNDAGNRRTQSRSATQGRVWLRRVLASQMLVAGLSGIVLLVLLTVLVPLFSPYSPYDMVMQDRMKPPSMEHWFGTDNFGRDLLTRVAYGGRVSLSVGLAVAAIAGFLGLVIGLYAAYFPTLDHILMRIADALMGFPSILLAIVIMATLGASTANVVLALVIVFTPSLARTVRSAALTVKEHTYVEAVRALGAGSTRTIWLHIAPNVLSPLITQTTFTFAEAIIVEAALSFLGVGVPPPDPSWGGILHDGKIAIFNAAWITIAPGLLIILAVLTLNLFGDGLRDILDPHTRGGNRK